jgi:hypothetical protein
MTLAITICAIAGMAIGFRFKIYLVVPAILAATVSILAVAWTTGDQYWSIASTMFMSAVALQIGYLCSSFAVSMKEVPAAEMARATGAPAKAYQAGTRFSA